MPCLARDAIDAAVGLDAEPFLRRAIRAVRRAVPHDAGGWSTTDPGTRLWTGGIMYGLPVEAGLSFYDNELLADDVLKFATLSGAGVLSEATDGDLMASPRYRTMYAPNGIADEVRLTFAIDGALYGTVCLLRRDGSFSPQDVATLSGLAKPIAQGLRAALVRPEAPPAEAPGTGVLLVDDALNVQSATPEAQQWLAELGRVPGALFLPSAVVSVVTRARAIMDGGADGPPRTRVRTATGHWVAVHASPMSDHPRSFAVVLEPARPAEVLPIIGQAHQLTAREQEVFTLLLRGTPDKQIAQELVVSAHTAREHVRNVQRKLGVRSRNELQALLHV